VLKLENWTSQTCLEETPKNQTNVHRTHFNSYELICDWQRITRTTHDSSL